MGEFSFLSCFLSLAQFAFIYTVERNHPTDLPVMPSDEGGPSTEIPLPKQLWLVSS